MAHVRFLDDDAWDPQTAVDGTRVLGGPPRGSPGGSPGGAASRMALCAWHRDGLRVAEHRAEPGSLRLPLIVVAHEGHMGAKSDVMMGDAAIASHRSGGVGPCGALACSEGNTVHGCQRAPTALRSCGAPGAIAVLALGY